MELAVLGIDVGKSEVYGALLVGERIWSQPFPNSAVGLERLLKWLKNRRVERVHACMEATGGWSEDVATFLHEHGHVVSIVNASAIHAFGQSTLSRTKTDKADAALIARFCVAMRPIPWEPPSPVERRLQRLVRRRVALDGMRVQEVTRLQAPGVDDVRTSIEQTIGFLRDQIADIDEQIRKIINDDPTLRARRDLLTSIPGIGERVAVTLLGELPKMVEFRSSKALAAYVGLCPREYRSGTSSSKSWLSRTGNVHVRKVLFMPALVAIRFNPVMESFAQRLRERGKKHKQILAAVMRRLLVLAYGVLRSGKPFEMRTGA